MNLLDTLLIAASFFGITLLAHLFVCRLGNSQHFLLKGLLLGITGTVACMGYLIYRHQFDIVGPYILFTLWLFYLMAFINLLNSVTLKMLASLYLAPSGTLDARDFTGAFNTEDGLQTRLAMLTANKLIQRRGPEWALTPKAKYLLSLVHLIKAVLSID